MHEGGSALEDNGIGDFNVSRIAVRDDTRGTGDRRGRAYQEAQRQRRLFAYRVVITEPHDG